jgi:hypothetical protein
MPQLLIQLIFQKYFNYRFIGQLLFFKPSFFEYPKYILALAMKLFLMVACDLETFPSLLFLKQ